MPPQVNHREEREGAGGLRELFIFSSRTDEDVDGAGRTYRDRMTYGFVERLNVRL